jgi:hypothetical protein
MNMIQLFLQSLLVYCRLIHGRQRGPPRSWRRRHASCSRHGGGLSGRKEVLRAWFAASNRPSRVRGGMYNPSASRGASWPWVCGQVGVG